MFCFFSVIIFVVLINIIELQATQFTSYEVLFGKKSKLFLQNLSNQYDGIFLLNKIFDDNKYY